MQDFSDLKQDFPKKYSTIVQIVEQVRFYCITKKKSGICMPGFFFFH
jgi:hypothetical protein